MINSLSRTLIETMIRKALKDIKDSPERSTRNLVDMALHFSEGRFQQHFLSTAQTILKNEQSSYYKIIPDIASAIDTNRIITFGMNLGYNSCTAGAKIIRKIEEKNHFNIPWTISLTIDDTLYPEQAAAYHSIIQQGMELGIYTWQIYAINGAQNTLNLFLEYSDCAFTLFCPPNIITDDLLDYSETIHNMMFIIQYENGFEEACKRLRNRYYLYSTYMIYKETDFEYITTGELFYHTEAFHPVFTLLQATPSCSLEMQSAVYQYVNQIRNQQEYKTVPFDILYDSRFIDSIISEDICSAAFDQNGFLHTFQKQQIRKNYNIFRQSLRDILAQAFPKTGNNLPVIQTT